MGPCPRVTLHRLPQRPFDQGAFPAAGGAGFYPVELSPQNFFRTVLALGRRRLGHADLARAQLPREGRAQGTIPESVSSPTTLLPLPATPTKGHVGSPGRWGPRNLECVDPSRRLPVRPVSPTRPATAAHSARLSGFCPEASLSRLSLQPALQSAPESDTPKQYSTTQGLGGSN